MSISIEDARAILAKLIEAQREDPLGALGSVSVGGRTVSYKSADDLIKMINYWSSVVADIERRAAGRGRIGFSVADFRGIR